MRVPRSCLILGSGMGGLALGALLARAGVDVTILEAHPDYLGGWAHTLAINGYSFSAGPRYLWNFGPGQNGRRFLEKCGLTQRVPMVELDRSGFDHIYVGDDEPIRVPNGWSAYETLLKERFPAEARGISRFFSLCRTVFPVFEIIDEQCLFLASWRSTIWNCFWRRPRATAWLLRHQYLTLEQAFQTCHLSQRLRAVLYAQSGIFALPPQSLSFHVYAAGTLFYHRGCYYPANDMAGFVGAIADTIQQHRGRILRNQRVVAVEATAAGIQHVKTQTAETFAADVVVVNFDPKTFLGMMNGAGAAGCRRVPTYTYSQSASSLFLGVTDSRILTDHFGKWNVWYSAGTESASSLNDAGPLDEPKALYVNSPTLVKGLNNDSPPGHATLTAGAIYSYQACKSAERAANDDWRARHTSMLIDLIERRFAPGLKEKIGALCLRTPQDKERIMLAPEGNIYGRSFDSREVWTRFPFKGVLPNLYFVGAYVTFAGIASVIHGACSLYQELTGDSV
jgi:all-trans-retinol 13,14-reductase